MQRAEDSSSRLLPEPSPKRAGLRPATAFIVLLFVVIAAGALIYLTRPEAPPAPTGTTTPNQQPNFALTNEEAVARFKELNESLIVAYENRDVSLIDDFLTSDSPLRKRAGLEIRQLIRDRVVPQPMFETKVTRILVNDDSRIVLKHVVVDSSRFVSESGRKITEAPKDILRVVEWTLELEGSEWRILDSHPVRSRVL